MRLYFSFHVTVAFREAILFAGCLFIDFSKKYSLVASSNCKSKFTVRFVSFRFRSIRVFQISNTTMIPKPTALAF